MQPSLIMANEFLETEEQILRMLKTVFDPEIPVNVYDLGLIYGIELKDDGICDITMTLTAPSCPAGDFIVEDIRHAKKFWQQIQNDTRTRICFDLYYCGIVLFDKKRQKQNYIVNF